ncbi:MAG: hypothetical protein ABIQ43_04200 [Sphingomonas sp.]
MSRHSLIYGLFCLGIVALSVFAIRDGYSPFASAGARGPMFFGGYGPTHK